MNSADLMAAATGLRNLAAEHQGLAPELIAIARQVEAAAVGGCDTEHMQRLGDAAERVLMRLG